MAKRKTMGLVAVEGDAEHRVACFRCRRELEAAKPRKFPFDVYNSDPEAEQYFELRGTPGAYEFRRLSGPTTDSMRSWNKVSGHVKCRSCTGVFSLASGEAINPEDVD